MMWCSSKRMVPEKYMQVTREQVFEKVIGGLQFAWPFKTSLDQNITQ